MHFLLKCGYVRYYADISTLTPKAENTKSLNQQTNQAKPEVMLKAQQVLIM